ncbi:MAG: crotonase [Actinobacteria bacterium]|nr:crotonase [Actinomycetota bacterium]
MTIDRAERRNALSLEVWRGISRRLAEAEADEAVRVVVLTGAGDKAFCAGGDLGGMTGGGVLAQHQERAELGDLFLQMRKSRLPIVARVNGHALAGGFGLMLACDHVIAVEGAGMGTPEINLGLWPFMITAVIQRDVPRKYALELMLTGKRITAREALERGIVNRVVAASELDGAVDRFVETIASKSPLITALGKRSFYEVEGVPVDQALPYLAGLLTIALQSEDTVEGVTAFLQKREPHWKGR